jgi:zinc protease
MFRRYAACLLIPALILIGAAGGDAQTPPGPRPENLTYPPLDFKPPKPSDFRAVLSNGLVVYIGENHEIPWFEASLMVRTGPFLEPAAKIGVEGVTPTVIRSGGTATMTGEQMNERMEFLAGSISATSLSIHMRHVDEGLRIWMDLLQNPAFPDDKLRREKEQMLVGIRNRNKNVAAVGARTYNQLIYGDDSPITAEPTEETVGSLAREDLVAWHRKYWGANNAILVVTGDFKRAEMLKKLEAAFGTWRNAEKAVPAIPKTIRQSARAGVYMVQPEVIPNQGVIRIGHLGLMQDDPDYAAMDVMNYILGGGSFSSRITKIVRSDHGLAYSTGSGLPGGVLYPGTFTASCQTKNSTVVFAAQLMLNEIERIRTEPVTEADVNFAKTARINAFPSMFPSMSAIVGNFARLEFQGRPMDFYDRYLARYEKVSVQEVKRVAEKYLRPENLVIMIAGNIDECRAGADNLLPNQDSIEAMASKFGGRTIDGLAKKYGDGTVHIVPLK